LSNGSFEAGNLSGWTVSIPLGQPEFFPGTQPVGTADIFQSLAGDNGVRTAVGGQNMLMLGTGASRRFLPPETPWDISVSQTLTLSAGDSISGWAFFFNGDFGPADSAWVKILDGVGGEIARPFEEFSGLTSGNAPVAPPAPVAFGSLTPWVQWSWQAPTSGTYTLSLGMSTFGDNLLRSRAGFDEVQVKVPEPSSLVLLAAGMLGYGARRRFWR